MSVGDSLSLAVAVYGFLPRTKRVEEAGHAYECSVIRDKITLGKCTLPILRRNSEDDLELTPEEVVSFHLVNDKVFCLIPFFSCLKTEWTVAQYANSAMVPDRIIIPQSCLYDAKADFESHLTQFFFKCGITLEVI
ncbi:unnamed protein product [Cylicostephanus goldi]|uniref:Uncharacterized protein n=1 Tax=Cylicostephanus goldi TaxID=71465 RepID=A0A3P6QMS9_CYLGO|nr:unnamed protein product [Cylicostephanus goldi]